MHSVINMRGMKACGVRSDIVIDKEEMSIIVQV